MKLIMILSLLSLISCATTSTKPIHLIDQGKFSLLLLPHVNWVHISDGALIAAPSANPEEISKAFKKAKEWEAQAISTKSSEFSKDLDSWLVSHFKLEFNYKNNSSYVSMCGQFGSALKLYECESIPASRYDEFIKIMDSAPKLIKEANDSKKVSQAFK